MTARLTIELDEFEAHALLLALAGDAPCEECRHARADHRNNGCWAAVERGWCSCDAYAEPVILSTWRVAIKRAMRRAGMLA